VVVHDWPGFSDQKQFGVDAAVHDWIFSLDADERVSPQLKKEIEALRTATSKADGYRIPRLSLYMGRWIHHSGWYPDKQLRLFDRRKGRWNGRRIHESVEMNTASKVGDLDSDIYHFGVENAAEHHKMIGERYAPLGARHMFENGITTSRLRVALAGPIAFLRSYVVKLGFLDGFPGFCIARFAAYHAYLKHLLLFEMQEAQLKELAHEVTTNEVPETSNQADLHRAK
ncbi:MAG TPA: glycosyltransferase family 2 protein, partial [Pyrinomonadaceae bacterium]|nr:glycosyltransferase family 2 protein [Pyrinomonadaceae bacterium]